jgi:L-asparaginase
VIGYLPDYRLTKNALANVSKCTNVVFFRSEILGDATITMAGQKTAGLKKLRIACQKRKTSRSHHLENRADSSRRGVPSEALSLKPGPPIMLILTTGGTIDKIYFDASSQFEVGDPTVPHIFEDVGAEIDYELISLFRKDSLEMTDEDREKIRQNCADTSHQQILITHGTDTMAMTAEVLCNLEGKIIVLTGAMAPSRFRVTDAIFNVGTAVGALQSMANGVYIAMNGKIFEAGKVRKNRDAGKFETL